jgi:diguanylate cyclase (GGDEF)-like protein
MMKARFLWFSSTQNGRLTFLAAAIVLLAVGGMMLCRSVVIRMLRVDAQATTSNWVEMLVTRNSEVWAMLFGATPSAQLRHTLDEASRVGDIYRFSIWDRTGHLVFNSERMKSAQATTALGEHQGQRIVDSVLSGTELNEVHAGNPPHDAPFFVKSLIPVREGGVLIGVFEVYLDQSDDKILYEKSLLFTEVIIGTFVLIAGCLPGYLVYRQMLDQRASKAEAQFQAKHDSLTGIPNRKYLKDVAKGALALNLRNKSYIAALMIDLNRFKDINDSFGHGAGDEVLKSVAMRLKSSIREQDLVARLGGDEFVVLQVGMVQPGGARFLADRLIEVLTKPYDIGGTSLACGVSIGVAIAPTDAGELDALLGCAGTALLVSKTGARNAVSFFAAEMDVIIHEQRRIEKDLARALETNSLQVVYQPLYSFHDGSLSGFAAFCAGLKAGARNLRLSLSLSPRNPALSTPSGSGFLRQPAERLQVGRIL